MIPPITSLFFERPRYIELEWWIFICFIHKKLPKLYPFVYLSVSLYLSTDNLFIRLSIYKPSYLFIYVVINPSIHPSIHLTYLPIYLLISFSVCVCAYTCVHCFSLQSDSKFFLSSLENPIFFYTSISLTLTTHYNHETVVYVWW